MDTNKLKRHPSYALGVLRSTHDFARNRGKGPGQFADRSYYAAVDVMINFVDWMRENDPTTLSTYDKYVDNQREEDTNGGSETERA